MGRRYRDGATLEPDTEVTMAGDGDILEQIDGLVAEEKALRERLSRHEIDPGEEHERLRELEVKLDQCWDLLRQRRALREYGGNEGDAQVRPAGEVEGYLG
jgi:hypothetical protein